MKPKLILCLVLVLSSGLIGFSQTTSTNGTSTNFPTNSSDAKIVSPQGVDLTKRTGSAIFREQSSCFSLQVPVGFRENGKRTNTNNPVVQVWLLRTDGTTIPQSGEPSLIMMGSIGNYSTDYMFYRFSKVPVNKLAGVVVSINGKLYCRELKKTN